MCAAIIEKERKATMSNNIQTKLNRFNFLAAEIDSAYHEAALRLGLSDSAMLILYTVCDSGDSCPLSSIMRLSGISKQTVNSSLRRLEAQGTVRLEPIGKKQKNVCLTEKGKAEVKSTVRRIIDIENRIFSSWDGREFEKYIELTDRYLNEFKKEIEEL